MATIIYFFSSKAYLFLLALVLLSTRMYAQNVGIGTALPNTGLDIVRDLALREAAAVTITGNQINSGTASHLRITNTGTINEILNPQDGKVLYLINHSGGAVILANNALATTNKIFTGSGADYSLPNSATAHLIYNATNQAWQLAGVSPGATSTNNAWLLLGNAGTNPTVNFVGTTDCNSLRFRVNNQFSGLIECAANDGNTAFGYNTMSGFGLRSVAIGDSVLGLNGQTDNVGIGYRALARNTTGGGNIAVGSRALLSNTTGFGNIAAGYLALYHNTTGFGNVATGYLALYHNTTGFGNVAAGFQPLYYNTTGGRNVATGLDALYSNTTGWYNVATGSAALQTNTTGWYNVATGYMALRYNTTGSHNVATGRWALYNTNTGWQNTAIGDSAGYSNTTGTANTYLGYRADANGNNYTNSTAIGANARVDASNSMVLGSINGVNGATANTNVGIGTTIPNTALDIARDLALRESPAVPIVTNQINSGTASHLRITNTGTINEILNPQDGKVLYLINHSGGAVILANNAVATADKIFTGSGADYSLPNGATAHLIYNATNQAWQLAGVSPGAAAASAGWLLTGNAGTNPAVNFLGTTDCNSLRFRVNNQFSGLIECAATDGNTAFGYNTPANPTAGGALRNVAVGDGVLGALAGGDDNTGIGYRALASNTTGYWNTAVGSQALFSNTTSWGNVGIGYQALRNNNNIANVAIGGVALRDNLTGEQNVSIGYQTLTLNISGSDNVAVGTHALYRNTTGWYNVGVGWQALTFNSTGWYNIGIGTNALYSNTTGYDNISFGFESLFMNTTGSNNIASGRYSLYNTTGSNNSAYGHLAGLSYSGNNNVFIGAYSSMNANYNNAIAIGANATVTSSNRIRMGNNLITNADIQVAWTVTSDKNEKSEIKYDVPGLKFITQLRPVTYYYNSHLQAHGKEKSIRYTGLLAQDVDSVLRGLGIVSSIVSKPNADGSGSWGIRYSEIVMPLIKGMQEQQAQIEALQQENATLKADNAMLKALTTKLEAEQASLKAAFEARLKLLEERAGIKAEK